MTFVRDVGKFEKKTILKGEIVNKKVAEEVYKGVVQRSPVYTQRFKASWRIGLGRVDKSVAPESKTGERLSVRFINQITKLTRVKWTDKVIISNSLVYAVPLEEGHSQQAPQGVLKVTMMSVQAKMDRIVRNA